MRAPEPCGPYTLLRWIESGGMGEIHVARGPRPDGGEGLAAVKRLLPQAASDPTFVQMFLDEGRLAKRLVHPNVCRLWDLGQHEGRYYMAMEWVDGVSLQLLVRRAAGRGGLPVALVCRIVSEVAAALDYAHRLADDAGQHLGVVHRDVSPPNIMIGLDGRVKLLDFGLAKARTQLAKTQPGYVKGKFGYLAPEQLSGKVDYRTDVFALGLCLYEALTSRQHFDESSAAGTIGAIRSYRDPPSARDLRPEVPEALDAVVRRALAARPSERFPSAGELKLHLDRVLADLGPPVTEEALASHVRSLFPERAPVELPAEAPGALLVDGHALAAGAVDLEEPTPSPRWPLWTLGILLLAAAAAAALLLTR